jgi:2-dehydro-3-deoxyphosphogluconate aldolase/(4S)-4-hydroxy-2-oxoglutarate aldolase
VSISRLASCKVVPVVTALDVVSTVELARALQRGGILAIEITLRTDSALDSIRAVRAEVPELLVAAGTVIDAATLNQAQEAGAELAFSPGTSAELLRAIAEAGMDFVPGVCTASEVMLCISHGYDFLKLYPAELAGGRQLLKSFAGPFPQVRFCPTGGLSPDNFRSYLELPNVVCCGGSWMVASTLVRAGDWGEIERLARSAMA